MAKKQGLSTKDLQAGFGVGHMTIYNWRAGTATKDPLPCEKDGSRVTFNLTSIKAWAKKYDLAFNPPTEKAAEVKPGPKAKIPGKVKPAVKAKFARVARTVNKTTASAVVANTKRAVANVEQPV